MGRLLLNGRHSRANSKSKTTSNDPSFDVVFSLARVDVAALVTPGRGGRSLSAIWGDLVCTRSSVHRDDRKRQIRSINASCPLWQERLKVSARELLNRVLDRDQSEPLVRPTCGRRDSR